VRAAQTPFILSLADIRVNVSTSRIGVRLIFYAEPAEIAHSRSWW
jgi:hypothetical protein